MSDGNLFSRREFVRIAGLGLLSAAAGACAPKVTKPPVRPYRYFPMVKVSEDRVIRQAVGLRPYRPSGFVVRRVRIGSKDVVHNYGHGGGGLTLSWGTSHIAVKEAAPLGHRTCAVLGCGAVGLATARLMQIAGYAVTIYAKDLPPHTTSNVAAGQWSPFTVFDEEMITPAFYREFLRATILSFGYFRKMIGSKYGVSVADNFYFGDYPVKLPRIIYDLPEIYGKPKTLVPGEYPFDEPSCATVKTMLIDTPTYLNAVMADFRAGGGRILVRDFKDVTELMSLREPLIMNCTGLGSYFLFKDRELEPVKGQLTVLEPQPEIDYITLMRRGGLYMMPRSDGIMLGGSHQYGDWSLSPDPFVTERIFTGQSRFWNGLPVV
jgi:D-amino-acid oxidase